MHHAIHLVDGLLAERPTVTAVECKQVVDTQWLIFGCSVVDDGCPTRLGSAVVPLGILGAWQCRWTPTMAIWTVSF